MKSRQGCHRGRVQTPTQRLGWNDHYRQARFGMCHQIKLEERNRTRKETDGVEGSNYMEGQGSAKKNNAAYPKHQDNEETLPYRNQIITSKR